MLIRSLPRWLLLPCRDFHRHAVPYVMSVNDRHVPWPSLNSISSQSIRTILPSACNVDGYYCPGGNVNATQYRMFAFDDDAELMDDELTVRASHACRHSHSLHRWLLLPGWDDLWHGEPYDSPVGTCTAPHRVRRIAEHRLPGSMLHLQSVR